ncbi:MAG: 5-(carboxyamino)imidazole ribonucleotide mutase [Pseudomonadota bacterium]
MTNPKVLVVMGSANDMLVMQEASKVLSEFGVESEVHVASAHRTPEKAAQLAKNAAGNGIKVIIAGAGFAAHLAGAMAAHSVLPVIGVPLEASPLSGIDSLLSTVQMPSGIPVACVAVGKAGARNAGILAVQMLALSDDALKEKLIAFRKGMAEKVEKANEELK